MSPAKKVVACLVAGVQPRHIVDGQGLRHPALDLPRCVRRREPVASQPVSEFRETGDSPFDPCCQGTVSGSSTLCRFVSWSTASNTSRQPVVASDSCRATSSSAPGAKETSA